MKRDPLRILHCADIHVSNRPEDEYRWEFFQWFYNRLKHGKYDAWTILGDLTEAKDNHPAQLVTRLSRHIAEWASVCPGFILVGNHDYNAECTHPFFEFLGLLPNVTFMKRTKLIELKGIKIVAQPHRIDVWDDKQIAINKRIGEGATMGWVHQAYKGFKTPSGKELVKHHFPKVSTLRKRYPEVKLFLAGDIHTPQTVDGLIYIGSPHPVDYGDDFKCRVIETSDYEVTPIERITIKKSIVFVKHNDKPEEVLKEYSVNDRLKFLISLQRSDLYRWDEITERWKSYCEKKRIIIGGIEPRVVNTETHKELMIHKKDGKRNTLGVKQPGIVFDAFAKRTKLEKEIHSLGSTIINKVHQSIPKHRRKKVGGNGKLKL